MKGFFQPGNTIVMIHFLTGFNSTLKIMNGAKTTRHSYW